MSAALKVTYYLLTHATPVTNVVSTRIYTNVAAQDAFYPFIVISGIGRIPSPTQDKDSAIDTHTIQVDLFAADDTSSSGIATLADLEPKVRAALVRVTGVVNGVRVNGIQSLGEGDEYDPVIKLHRKRIDFQIRLTNPI